ncbi:GtrA family protein [Plastoroseomonas arctica]|uniref:GtrA family protein n=1 Tax=Plastoroseomonas arctica TaxID=1509237 RepID=A0AAF1KM57_9PROT|nr:GtrA family protein [Plastoroseomonas arctica]MBR0655826.1 GtrA family protein [Plastoroseomonas arctica]
MTDGTRRVLRFLATGGLNTAFGYGCYAAFVATGVALWVAVAGATVLAMLFNFRSYGRLVFGDARWSLLPRFVLFYAALGAVNFALLRALGAAGVGPLLAQALLLPVLAAIGYLGMQRFVFRRSAPGVPAWGS